jgi:hypothetical protein
MGVARMPKIREFKSKKSGSNGPIGACCITLIHARIKESAARPQRPFHSQHLICFRSMAKKFILLT